VYWFVSYEPAGTVLLLGFGLATGLVSFRLLSDPGSRRVRAAAREASPGALAESYGPGGGTGGVDRPFLDERGRLPDESIAPFAVGLGAALASTALIFGPAPAIVGLLPFAWGAWAWLSGARAELDAQVEAGDIDVEAGDTRAGSGSPRSVGDGPSAR
jgi:hypothetical protein